MLAIKTKTLLPHKIEGIQYNDSFKDYGIVDYRGIALTKELIKELESLDKAETLEEIIAVQNKVTNLSQALKETLIPTLDEEGNEVYQEYEGAYEYTRPEWIRERGVHNSEKVQNEAHVKILTAESELRQSKYDSLMMEVKGRKDKKMTDSEIREIKNVSLRSSRK